MTYEDLIKSSDWVKDLSASYFESLGAKVLIFKLDKTDTKLNPIYNEEIDGRKYLRPFETKCIYKTDPFSFNFDNTLPSETEGSLKFYFNFEVMAKTIEALKRATSEMRITAKDPGWSMAKSGDNIYLYNKEIVRDHLVFNTNEYMTVSELSQAISDFRTINESGKSRMYFTCRHGGDDYTKCIPSFPSTNLKNTIVVKTFNSEFKNAQNIIEEGDLIYIVSTNALYEVTSAYPVNNTMYRYINWQCNAQRTFAYVEYEKLKSYQYKYGLGII